MSNTGKPYFEVFGQPLLSSPSFFYNGASPKRTQKKSSLVLGNHKAISARTSALLYNTHPDDLQEYLQILKVHLHFL